MRHIKYSIIALLATFSACTEDPNNPPMPIESITNGNNDDTGMDPPGATDSTGGQYCEEGWLVYQCRGVIIPIYRYMNGGDGTSVFWSAMDPDGVGPMPVQNPSAANGCSDDIFIAAPESVPDNPGLFAACEEQCNIELAGLVYPEEIGPYKLESVQCIFEANSNGGMPDTDDPIGAGQTALSCDWITAPPVDQVVIDGDATAENCMSLDCSTWNPNSFISWSYNTSTRTHTTVMPSWFLDEMLAESGGRMYACDESRFYHGVNPANNAPTSRIYAVAGDALYRMGFRTNDFDLTIQRAGSSTYPVYSLSGYVNVAIAWAALSPYSNFVVKFKRPNRTGGADVHTMNLTLPAP